MKPQAQSPNEKENGMMAPKEENVTMSQLDDIIDKNPKRQRKSDVQKQESSSLQKDNHNSEKKKQ